MIGSPTVAAWVAHAGFWILMALGWAFGEIRLKATLIVLSLWAAGFVGFPYAPYGNLLLPPFLALLDAALVLVIFKGDIRLS